MGWALGALFVVVFFGHYLPRKERSESRRLEARHGARFVEYRSAVRALWPRLRPWRPAEASGSAAGRWEFERYWENDEQGTLALVLAAALALFLRLPG